MTKLCNVAPGLRGRVVQINLDTAEKQRLQELGLTVGASISLVRTAPLGDPIEVTVRGYQLSLRKADAANVLIDVDEAPVTAHNAS